MKFLVMIFCCLQLCGYLFAAYNYKTLEGANSVYCQSHSENGQGSRSVADTKGSTGPVMKEGKGYDLVIGNENSRNKIFKGEGGELFLGAKIPNTVQTIGGKEFSVGGDVQVPFKVLPDEECKWWDKTCKARKDNEFSARWNRDTGCVEMPQKVYDAISCREAKSGGFLGDMYCGIKRGENIDNTLTHEAVHVAFDEEYLKLDGDDVDVKAQYHFVSEMMAYMIGDGMSPDEAAQWAVKSAPDDPKLKEKIKALSDVFLKGEFRFRDPADILREKGNASADEIGVRGWCKCGDNHGKKFLSGYGMMNIFAAGGTVGALFGSEEVAEKVLKDALKDDSIEYECPCVYMLCGRCGKCMRNEDVVDVKVVRRLHMEGVSADVKESEMKKAQDRLKAIPDGQIVVPGKCSCKEPDVIKTGFVDNQEFYVCLLCGLVYVPVDCSVPIGPTARGFMGLKEPK